MNAPAPKTSVLLVDDSDDLTKMLTLLINGEPDLMCVGRLSSANELHETVEKLKPSVVLLDLTMPGLDALTAMSRTAPEFPHSRFIVLSGHDDREVVDRAIDSGAWGFVFKHSEAKAILAAIRAVATGKPSLPTI